MKLYTEKYIEQKYNEINEAWEKYLKDVKVKPIKLKKSNGSYTIDALVLIYLYDNIKKPISKEELTAFLRNMGYETNDVQQARHLATQKGWYIISGSRGDIECNEYNVSKAEYMLMSITEPYPQYDGIRRSEQLKSSSFDELKKHYHNRCVSCGSKENEKNYLYPNSTTQLQQGHKNPKKPLSMDNIIPQCQFCNGASKDFFVFDNKGKVEKISNPQFVLKSDEEVQLEMLKLLILQNKDTAKKILEDLEKKDYVK